MTISVGTLVNKEETSRLKSLPMLVELFCANSFSCFLKSMEFFK